MSSPPPTPRRSRRLHANKRPISIEYTPELEREIAKLLERPGSDVNLASDAAQCALGAAEDYVVELFSRAAATASRQGRATLLDHDLLAAAEDFDAE